jgi:hypothetical protein
MSKTPARSAFAISCVVSVLALASAAFAQHVHPSTQPAQEATSQPAATSQPTATSQPAPTSQPAAESSQSCIDPRLLRAFDLRQPSREFLFWPQPAPLEGNISTERPGFSDSAVLMPRGHVQLETGYTYTYDHVRPRTNISNHTLPEFELRTGVTDALELRVKWTGYSATDTLFVDQGRSGLHYWHRDHDDGWTDMSVGIKTPLLQQKGLIPNLAILPSLSIPTGSASKSTRNADFSLSLPWNYNITDKLVLYGDVILAIPTDAEGHWFQTSASTGVCYQLTDRLSWFFEYYGYYPSARGTDCQHNINTGPILLLTKNTQLDFRVGMGLNDEAPDLFTGVGFSVRF